MLLKTFGTLLAILLIQQNALAAAKACNNPDSGICIETNNPDIDFECEGTLVNSCPVESRVGTCLFGNESDGVMSRFYPAYPGNPKADCEESNGVYSAG